MKSKLFRACGVAAALLIPAGGLMVLSTGIAAAQTTKVKVVATTVIGKVTCPTQTWATPLTCTAHSPAPATLPATVGGINETDVVTNHVAINPTISIPLAACTVSIVAPATRSIPLTQNAAPTTNIYSATISLTNTATPPVTRNEYNFTATAGCGPLNHTTITLTITVS